MAPKLATNPQAKHDGELVLKGMFASWASVAGLELRQALLFESVSEYVSLVVRMDSKTQESQRGRSGLSWFRTIGAIRPAADDPYSQKHPKLGGYNRVYRRKRDLVGG